MNTHDTTRAVQQAADIGLSAPSQMPSPRRNSFFVSILRPRGRNASIQAAMKDPQNWDIGYDAPPEAGLPSSSEKLRQGLMVGGELDPELFALFVNDNLFGGSAPWLKSPFGKNEEPAKAAKRHFFRTGWVCLASALLSLMAGVASLLFTALSLNPTRSLDNSLAVASIFGVGGFIAALGSWRGSTRATWLDRRYAAEVLRLAHFATLLNGQIVNKLRGSRQEFSNERDRALLEATTTANNHSKQAGQRERLLSRTGHEDVIQGKLAPWPFELAALMDKAWEVYKVVRIGCQADFAYYKISRDKPLRRQRHIIHSLITTLTTLSVVLVGLGSFVTLWGLFTPTSDAVAVILTSVGLGLFVLTMAIRSFDERLGISKEIDHYTKYASDTMRIRSRAKALDENLDLPGPARLQEQYQIMVDMERTATVELIDFLQIHSNTHFV